MEMASSKWVATAASIWIQCTAGSSYAFGIYSPLLKSTQSYDQSTLNTVSVFKDIGANAGVLSGLLFSAVSAAPLRRPPHPSSLFSPRAGPWVVHLAGAIQCFVGYFFLWAAITGTIPRPPLPLACLFMFLAAHAQTFFNTASVVTGVYNFPGYGGTIVGIMKGFLGLSGPMLIQLYQFLFNDNPSLFVLMLALLPTIVSSTLMCFVRTCQINTGDDKKHLDRLSVTALVLAGYLMITIILENIFSFPQWARTMAFIILLFLVTSPLCISLKAQREDSEGSSQMVIEGKSLLLDPEPVVPMEESKNILQAMWSLDFWLLFVAMVSGMGSGLAVINNISQIGESLSYTALETNTLISLWGIWNFLGRFGAGYVSDMFLHRWAWPRPSFMAITLATMSLGHFIMSSGLPGNLYAGSVLLGICYGSQWSLMPTITSEIFGLWHMGTIFNTLAIASPVGSYILSVRVMAFLYDKEVSEFSDGASSSCFGTQCFMLSFFILACSCLLGFLSAVVLFFRTKSFYRSVVIRRLQQTEKL